MSPTVFDDEPVVVKGPDDVARSEGGRDGTDEASIRMIILDRYACRPLQVRDVVTKIAQVDSENRPGARYGVDSGDRTLLCERRIRRRERRDMGLDIAPNDLYSPRINDPRVPPAVEKPNQREYMLSVVTTLEYGGKKFNSHRIQRVRTVLPRVHGLLRNLR